MQIEKKKISEFFYNTEFLCKCGKCNDYEISKHHLTMLDFLRIYYGKPIIIVSGRRCKNWNHTIKGNKNSAHLRENCSDIKVTNSRNRYKILEIIFKRDLFNRIGINSKNGFIHLDNDDSLVKEVLWTYND
ncbi:unnamed protein product [marine sediment metagenome]|uniref:Peptidase M15A C-terminal domain-containing protein n=1 Tax=marine sediment metagenome TaxID=412755 RepID=X0WZU0_9ZZZZ